MKRYALLLVAAVVLCGTGCDTIKNLFSSTSPSATTTTDAFSGSIVVGGTSFFTFTVVNPGTVSVDLTTLGVNSPVGLGIGIPNGTTSCTLASTSQSTVAGGSPQLTESETAGTFCVAVFDPGTLTSATTFSVTVSHP
jgi:hypothetical protein